jgi:response regulator RpfG family c-di-GMP phosphodiesterase
MSEDTRTILCVDDEENILHAVRRLLRREGYRILTATGGLEALNLMAAHPVNLVISDQRMPHMTGTEFLTRVRESYPDVIRIILTGYTDVDSITEAVNRGLIYKFLLKPWNDEDFKLDIRQAFEQYDLVQTNRSLHHRVMEQNEALQQINENLEDLVQRRTEELEIIIQSLELAQAVLEDVPVPVVGVSAEGTVVLINRETQKLPGLGEKLTLGRDLLEVFPEEPARRILELLDSDAVVNLRGCRLGDRLFDLGVSPLSGRFRGRGVVMSLRALLTDER